MYLSYLFKVNIIKQITYFCKQKNKIKIKFIRKERLNIKFLLILIILDIKIIWECSSNIKK